MTFPFMTFTDICDEGLSFLSVSGARSGVSLRAEFSPYHKARNINIDNYRRLRTLHTISNKHICRKRQLGRLNLPYRHLLKHSGSVHPKIVNCFLNGQSKWAGFLYGLQPTAEKCRAIGSAC
ncbi:uncharacterized protein Dsimw501_GD28061 [Drosophila simulans]|uniref:Uncharacterized protein n=1 Tax=Drosophila simulans TaxID=7240 RepID=A0A0J9S1V1_DROSI|nr:uncharacterized protein Dsimw501_GD28061 [Drosophila simulans]